MCIFIRRIVCVHKRTYVCSFVHAYVCLKNTKKFVYSYVYIHNIPNVAHAAHVVFCISPPPLCSGLERERGSRERGEDGSDGRRRRQGKAGAGRGVEEEEEKAGVMT